MDRHISNLTFLSHGNGRYANSIGEHDCKAFPSFRDPDLREFVLRYHCFHSSEEEQLEDILRDWTYSEHGEWTKSRLLMVFQHSTTPGVIALALANMLVLWNLHSSSQQGGSYLRLSALSDLKQLLSGRLAFSDSNSNHLLLELLASFNEALKGFESKGSTRITQFMRQSSAFIESGAASDELVAYFERRLRLKRGMNSMDYNIPCVNAVVEQHRACWFPAITVGFQRPFPPGLDDRIVSPKWSIVSLQAGHNRPCYITILPENKWKGGLLVPLSPTQADFEVLVTHWTYYSRHGCLKCEIKHSQITYYCKLRVSVEIFPLNYCS